MGGLHPAVRAFKPDIRTVPDGEDYSIHVILHGSQDVPGPVLPRMALNDPYRHLY